MSDFFEELSIKVAREAIKKGQIDRDSVSNSYYSIEIGDEESESVSEKWIDLIYKLIKDLKISNSNEEIISQNIYRNIAKL